MLETLFNRLVNGGIKNVVWSNFQNKYTQPYTIINLLSNTLHSKDTCNSRLEHRIYQITSYDDSFRSLVDTVSIINQQLNKSFQFLNQNITEPIRGIYEAKIQFEVLVQTHFKFLFAPKLSGKNLYEVLLKGYNESDLCEVTNGFCGTEFVRESWNRPWIFIPEYNTVTYFITTCNTQARSTKFSISLEAYNPVQLESILEKIDQAFSYSKMQIDGKNFLGLEWLGNSINEIAPNIWQGAVDYEIILEE
jgi:hypothetical protein